MCTIIKTVFLANDFVFLKGVATERSIVEGGIMGVVLYMKHPPLSFLHHYSSSRTESLPLTCFHHLW